MVQVGIRHDGTPVERTLTRRTRKLALWNEPLARVDLDVLTRAPALESLDLSARPGLTQLDLTPVGRHCPALHTLSLRVTSPVDLAPLAACRALSYLSIDGRGWPTIDLGPLAALPALSSLSLIGPAGALDLAPLAATSALTDVSINECGAPALDLAPLAVHIRLEALDISQCKRLTALDLGACAHHPALRYLFLKFLPLRELDLTPLAVCGALERMELYLHELSVLDVTAIAGHERLRDVMLAQRSPGAGAPLVADLGREQIRAPAVRAHLRAGAVRPRRTPTRVLGGVAWSFADHLDPTAPEDVTDDVVIAVPAIRVLAGQDAEGAARPAITIAADRPQGLTGLHLFHQLRTRLGTEIAPCDHHFFEGLSLYEATAWDAIPTYCLQLGS